MNTWLIVQFLFILSLVAFLFFHALVVALAQRSEHLTRIQLPKFWLTFANFITLFIILAIFVVMLVGK